MKYCKTLCQELFSLFYARDRSFAEELSMVKTLFFTVLLVAIYIGYQLIDNFDPGNVHSLVRPIYI